MAAFLMVAAVVGAKLGKRIAPGKIIAGGTFLAAGGFLFFAFLDPRSTAFDIILPLSIMAFGLGLGMSHRPNLIASSAPEGKVGIASSVFVLVRNIAGAFGVAVFATILSGRIQNNVIKIAKHTVVNTHTPAIIKQVVALVILKAQVSAYGHIFIIASFFLFTGGIAALFIKVKNRGKKTVIIAE